MRKLAGALGMTAAVFAIAAPALGAGTAPKPGDYEALPKAQGSVGLGVFRVDKIDGKFHLVAGRAAIRRRSTTRTQGKCHGFDIGLSGTDYPISSKGQLPHQGHAERSTGKDLDGRLEGPLDVQDQARGLDQDFVQATAPTSATSPASPLTIFR